MEARAAGTPHPPSAQCGRKRIIVNTLNNVICTKPHKVNLQPLNSVYTPSGVLHCSKSPQVTFQACNMQGGGSRPPLGVRGEKVYFRFLVGRMGNVCGEIFGYNYDGVLAGQIFRGLTVPVLSFFSSRRSPSVVKLVNEQNPQGHSGLGGKARGPLGVPTVEASQNHGK